MSEGGDGASHIKGLMQLLLILLPLKHIPSGAACPGFWWWLLPPARPEILAPPWARWHGSTGHIFETIDLVQINKERLKNGPCNLLPFQQMFTKMRMKERSQRTRG